MSFFSGIRNLLHDIRHAQFIYALSRKNPEQLKNAHAELHAILKTLQEGSTAHFHRATGSALTTWAIMEERLVLIASLLLRTSPRKGGLIFYSIINFQVWIAIITELFGLENDYFSDFQRRWNKLYERLRAEKDSRDQLAHHAVLSADISDNPLQKTIKKASRLDFRSKSRSLTPMSLEQVVDFADRIGAISDDLLKLLDDMLDHHQRLTHSASQDKSSVSTPDRVP
jgi:hypothetical protein